MAFRVWKFQSVNCSSRFDGIPESMKQLGKSLHAFSSGIAAPTRIATENVCLNKFTPAHSTGAQTSLKYIRADEVLASIHSV